MKKSFKLTEKQQEAMNYIGGLAMFCMLFGGSRSGKTFILVRSIIIRALAAENSRHAILRYRFNHVKASIVHDTFPKVMSLCFPQIRGKMDKTDWYYEFPNGSQIWFGGLDDKERTEKILGQEYVTIYLNETSQISYRSFLLVKTRLAQVCYYERDGEQHELTQRFLLDCNPPSEAHWTYTVFIKKYEPTSRKSLPDPSNYTSMLMNPKDNKENLSKSYLSTLENLPARMKERFWEGKFANATENALFTSEMIDKWRQEGYPELVRVVVAVDPSGASDDPDENNDDIGIGVAGLGIDGNAYVLEDCTINAGPKTWGNFAVSAYDRHRADCVVGETNYGGEMVKFVIQTARPGIRFKKITASRGKTVRAEPISSLVEQGKVRFIGDFPELEDELCGFTTFGYTGDRSPNRADWFVFAITELFPGVVRQKKEKQKKTVQPKYHTGAGAWMG